jgi:hypothetical protein
MPSAPSKESEASAEISAVGARLARGRFGRRHTESENMWSGWRSLLPLPLRFFAAATVAVESHPIQAGLVGWNDLRADKEDYALRERVVHGRL